MKQYHDIIEQHRKLTVALSDFNRLRNETEPEIKEIGEEIAKLLTAAKKEHGFKTDRYYEDWMSSYDFISIEYDEDKINIEFWEDGRCGNQDECLHSIELTEELLTTEGRAAYAARWVEEMKMKQTDKERQASEERIKKIQRLEAEIKQLQSN